MKGPTLHQSTIDIEGAIRQITCMQTAPKARMLDDPPTCAVWPHPLAVFYPTQLTGNPPAIFARSVAEEIPEQFYGDPGSGRAAAIGQGAKLLLHRGLISEVT